MTELATYGPWAVIAGGSEGVGAEFARILADAGINLVLIARKSAPLEATATECRERGVEVRTLALDLVEPTAVARIADATMDLEVGLLIYNAGANTCSEHLLDGDLADFQRVIDLNITALMALVQQFGRHAQPSSRRHSDGRVNGGLSRVGAAFGLRRGEGVRPDLCRKLVA